MPPKKRTTKKKKGTGRKSDPVEIETDEDVHGQDEDLVVVKVKKVKKTTPKKKTGKRTVQVETKEEEPEEEGEPGEEKIHVRGIGWTYASRLPENVYLLTLGTDEQGITRYHIREYTPSDEEDEETWLQNKQNRRENFPDVDLNSGDEGSSDEEEASEESEYEMGKNKRKKGKGKAKASPRKAAARKKGTGKKPAAAGPLVSGRPPPGAIPVWDENDDDAIVVVKMMAHEIVKDWGLGADEAGNKPDEDLIAEGMHDGPLTKRVLSGKEKDDAERFTKIFTKIAELERDYEFEVSNSVPQKRRRSGSDSAGPASPKVKTEPASDSEEEKEAPALEPPPPERSYHTQADEDEAYAGETSDDDYDSLVEEFGDEDREGRGFHFVHDLTDPVVLGWVVHDIFCERHPVGEETGAVERMRAKIGRLSGEGIIAVLTSIVNAALRLKRFTVLQQGVSEDMQEQEDAKFRKKFWACQAMTKARLHELVSMAAWIKESWDLHHSQDRSRWEGIVERWDRKLAVYKYFIGQAAIAYGQWEKRVVHEKTGKRTKKRDREVSREMKKWLPDPDSSDVEDLQWMLE